MVLYQKLSVSSSMSNDLTICVFCGSQTGQNQRWQDAATQLGQRIAEAGYRLVYGGGKTGLMKVLADAALARGSPVTGIFPKFLDQRKWAHDGIDEMVLADDMHERKKRMYECADACVGLPGGLGTLDELIEIITWKSLGRHNKPIILANIDNFWQPLIALLDHFQHAQLLYQHPNQLIHISSDIDAIVPDIQHLLCISP